MGTPGASATEQLEAGTACPFAVSVDAATGFKAHDLPGGRTIYAGTAGFTITNTDRNKSITLPSRGFAEKVTTLADGTQNVVDTGQQVLVLFPEDSPAGPSTTLITGRVVYTITDTQFIVQSITGQTVDICAAIA